MSHGRKKILILAANPKGTARLRLDEEVREIQAGLERAQQREQFEIIPRWAIRPDDLRRALLDNKPQIVHFSGHGTGETGLAVEDSTGQVQLLPTKALASLLGLFQECVECVVLNACYSEVQAEAINQHINCVIGMSQGIGDRAAIQFATGFYDALGAGRSYADAYKFGCNAIDLENIPENLTPQIKQRSPSASDQPTPVRPNPVPPDSSRPLDLLYSQAYQLYQAGRWQDVLHTLDRIKTIDANYPDSRGLRRSTQQEQKLAAFYDRALQSENRRELQTALQQLEEVRQLRQGYRDTETRIARLKTQSQTRPRSLQSSVPLFWLMLAWSLSWVLIGSLAYSALSTRTGNSSLILICAGFGLVGGAVSSLVRQLIIVHTGSINPKQIVLLAGLSAGIWMLIGFIVPSGDAPLAAPIAAFLSLVSNVFWQLFQPKWR